MRRRNSQKAVPRFELETQNGEPNGSPFILLCLEGAQMIFYLLASDAHRMSGVAKFVSLLSPVESSKFLQSYVDHRFLVRLRDVDCNR